MGERQHKCKCCKKRFERPSDLKRHYKIHTGEKAFTCDVCGISFSQSGNLLVHKRIHTGVKPYECNVCDKTFSQKSSLARHKRTHTGETPFVCGKCGKAFSNPYHLICHNRTHAGVKPYKCSKCGKKFSQCGGLISHKRTHTGEKLFKCNICGKKYSQASGLRKHKETHISEIFTCNICDKQFSKASNLTKHKITHTGGKYFDCNVHIRDVLPARSFLDRKGTHTAVNLFKFDIRVKVTKESYSDLPNDRALAISQKHAYQCDLCEEIFASSELLSVHKELHTEQQMSDVVSHEQLEHHLDDKLKNNNSMKESFGDRSHQTAPAMSQEELYQCDLCERIFASSGLLTLHKEFHTGQQTRDVISHKQLEYEYHLDSELEADEPSGITYICADCDEEFELVDELFKHSEMSHVISTS
ncbi:zinc finger 271-like [Paramuricea clavata]|uniref:Zinc finger 271-like n=1 Tax=Paramuricea clavata TaxID=317549 RepID=A0A6S7FWX4_PARCT|nr:zinc finger 271-like [Paramuricea clavata]